MKLIGIDDAGRGPVIGPMVLAGVLIEEEEEQEIKSLGVKDSKALSRNQRLTIKNHIEERFKSFFMSSSPQEIDESTNLNYLEAIKAAAIVNKLMEHETEQVRVFIDCPSTNIASWSEDVQNLLKWPEKVELICEHKADELYPVVSAASIMAKETREKELDTLRDVLDVDFGSGYPADPKTKEFLKKYVEEEKYKNIIRFSWKTVKNLIGDKKQSTLF